MGGSLSSEKLNVLKLSIKSKVFLISKAVKENMVDAVSKVNSVSTIV